MDDLPGARRTGAGCDASAGRATIETLRSHRAAQRRDMARRGPARAVRAARIVRAARPAPAAGHGHDHRRGPRRRAGGPATGDRRRARRSPSRRAASTPTSPARCRSAPTPWPRSSSSWSARPTGPTASCSSTVTAGTARPSTGPWRRWTARGGGSCRGGPASTAATPTPATPRPRCCSALRPDLVRRERAVAGATAPLGELAGRLRAARRAGGLRPTACSATRPAPDAEAGRAMFERLVDDLVAAVDALGRGATMTIYTLDGSTRRPAGQRRRHRRVAAARCSG